MSPLREGKARGELAFRERGEGTMERGGEEGEREGGAFEGERERDGERERERERESKERGREKQECARKRGKYTT